MLNRITSRGWRELRRFPQRVRFVRKAYRYTVDPVGFLRRRQAASDLPVGADARSLVDTIRARGYASVANVSPGLLAEIDPIICQKLTQAERIPTEARKDFWKKLLSRDDRSLQSPFVRYCLQPEILGIVGSYLGQVPYLSRLELILSFGETATATWKISQLWHRDYDDGRMLKLWTYFSDVHGADDGPFTLIPADVSKGLGARRFPTHMPDELMARLGGTPHAVQITGPKFTSFLVDTHRCFHLGSRLAPGHIRVGLAATYLTCASYYPYDNEIIIDRPLSPLEQMVLRPGASAASN